MKITELKTVQKRKVRQKNAEGQIVVSEIEELALRPVKVASASLRIGNFFSDLILMQILWQILEYTAFSWWPAIDFDGQEIHVGFFTMIYFGILLYPFYYILFEGIWQRTPGKFLTKTVVINEYAQRPDLITVVLRNLLRLIPFEPLSGFVKRMWHDRLTGTYVVLQTEQQTLQQLLHEQENEK